MVGEIFEVNLTQMAKSASKFSTVAGQNFELYLSQMAKIAS